MSVAKLTKQLKRDLKANPKKAGMLAMLCLVCAYFWGPLVFPKEEPKKPTAKASMPAASAATPSPSVAAAAETTPQAGLMDWRELARYLTDSPHRSAVINANQSSTTANRNPFAVIEEKKTMPKVEEAKTPPVTKAALDALNLAVTGTMIGEKVQRAVINGRGYSRGETIAKLQEKDVLLAGVGQSAVIIEWNGIRRELKLSQRGKQNKDAGGQVGSLPSGK